MLRLYNIQIYRYILAICQHIWVNKCFKNKSYSTQINGILKFVHAPFLEKNVLFSAALKQSSSFLVRTIIVTP